MHVFRDRGASSVTGATQSGRVGGTGGNVTAPGSLAAQVSRAYFACNSKRWLIALSVTIAMMPKKIIAIVYAHAPTPPPTATAPIRDCGRGADVGAGDPIAGLGSLATAPGTVVVLGETGGVVVLI